MKRHSAGEIFMAWLPYLLLVVFVLVWGEPTIKAAIDRWTDSLLPSCSAARAPPSLNGLNVPGLHNLITRIPPVTGSPRLMRPSSRLNWLSASGTACFLATDRDGAGPAACGPAQFVEHLRGHVQAAEARDADDRVDARPRLPDELFRHDVDAGPRARGHAASRFRSSAPWSDGSASS